MLVTIVNEEQGYGYDEDGDPVILVDGMWKEVTGGWIGKGDLQVEFSVGCTKGYRTIRLAARAEKTT